MFDHPILKAICLIALLITLFGGINYFFVANDKDLVMKMSSKAKTRKALYYTIGISVIVLFIMKLYHMKEHATQTFYYY